MDLERSVLIWLMTTTAPVYLRMLSELDALAVKFSDSQLRHLKIFFIVIKFLYFQYLFTN